MGEKRGWLTATLRTSVMLTNPVSSTKRFQRNINQQKPEGGKMQKDRLAVLFLSDTNGLDKNVPMVDQRSLLAFEERKFRYYAIAKAWMTGTCGRRYCWTSIAK